MFVPLKGMTVVDLTHVWAGPQCTLILAALGAKVIKVENRKSPDRWRGPVNGTDTWHRYADGTPGDEPLNRNALFNSINMNKKDITLNLKAKEGKIILEGLLEKADILVENFRPGVLGRLGFSFDALKKINNKLIILSLSGFGATGPYKMYSAFGSTLDPVAGMSALNSYDGKIPSLCGISVCDPIGAIGAVSALLSELLRQRKDGKRTFKWLDVSLYEPSVVTIMQTVIEFLEKGGKNLGAQQETAYMIDEFFPCKGDDEWVAITVENQKGIDDLKKIIGCKRDCGIDNLRIAVRSWTAKNDKHKVTEILQKMGIATGPVQSPKDIIQDAHLNGRGFWQKINHPKAGMRLHASLPIMINGRRIIYSTPAPCLGEHNKEVLRELGYKSIEALKEEGVI